MQKPKTIYTIYDNGGKTMDRYTVVTNPTGDNNEWECLGLSDNPNSVQGFSQWSICLIGRHLGKKITFEQLPKEVQGHVASRLKFG